MPLDLRVFTDARCLLHATPSGYPEVRERLSGILARFATLGWQVADAGPHPDARSAVERVHSAAYVARFERAQARGDGLLDSADNPMSPGTWDAAWGAVSATLHAASWAVAGDAPRIAFAAVRPPGHHAEHDLAMGFCFFNNVAVAADYLRARGCERVAILDFDVHHGNGTQHIFYERPDVLYISTHQFPFYPGTGRREEQGAGAGWGFTLNEPLSAGAGDAEYGRVFDESVIPALASFRPEILLLSAGFDAWQEDPLGGMKVTGAGFRGWGRRLGEWARASCPRVLAVLEGGYDLAALPDLAVAHLEGLSESMSGAAERAAGEGFEPR